MVDATLRLLDSLRAFCMPATADDPALSAFVRLVAAPSSRAADAAWTTSLIERALTMTGAAGRAETFAVLYDGACAAAEQAETAPAPARTSGALALEGLLGLPPRERAVLALSCVLGFSDSELAHVIGESPDQVHAVLEAAIAAVRAAAADGRWIESLRAS